MAVVHMSEGTLVSLVEARRRNGLGRLDECWEGKWHLTDPTARHQKTAGRVYRIHSEAVEDAGRGTVWISINVTDREEGWIDNHRCPDGAVILRGNPGRWIGENQAAFLGGPDLIVEVRSDGDDPEEKFPFYGSLGVKEILVLDPERRLMDLWRNEKGRFRKVSIPAKSTVTGLEYIQGPQGFEIRDPVTGRAWAV